MLREALSTCCAGWLLLACGGHTDHEDIADASAEGGRPSTQPVGGATSTNGGNAAVPESPRCAHDPTGIDQFQSRNYYVEACGFVDTCTPGDPPEQPLASPLRIDMWLVAGISGSVRIADTGLDIVDGRAFDATIEGDVVTVEHEEGIDGACPQPLAISLSYDFSARGARRLDIDFEQRPDCVGDPGRYCQGGLHAELGEADWLSLK